MFITLEGPEGAGKSTQIHRIAEWFRLRGREAVVTREPGSGPLGGAIRSILLDAEEVPPKSELFLFLADRAQHVKFVIRPGLERGAVVVCDRQIDSFVVYQGAGRGFDLEEVRSLSLFASDGLKPDRTYLLDLDPEVGLRRHDRHDRLDREPIEFHLRIRAAFLAEANREPDRIRVVDASLPAEDVWRQIESDLLGTL